MCIKTFHSFRDYGTKISTIHWKSAACHARWKVSEERKLSQTDKLCYQPCVASFPLAYAMLRHCNVIKCELKACVTCLGKSKPPKFRAVLIKYGGGDWIGQKLLICARHPPDDNCNCVRCQDENFSLIIKCRLVSTSASK